MRIPIGIIGGSGLYQMEALKIREERAVETPFGNPSDALIFGTLEGKEIVFLPRHGRGHRFSPSEINYRANIYALKSVGVERILSVSATGSMKEHLVPGHMVVVDQFIDRTQNRVSTFFEKGVVGHVSFADPVCPELLNQVYAAGTEVGVDIQKGGTYICIEGPMFSSRAESNVYRSWGVDVIGMTNVQEAKLAREAELCYVTLALVTDYDCWHESEEAVNAEMVMQTMAKNIKNAQALLCAVVKKFPVSRKCSCGQAAAYAIMTDRKRIPADAKKRLELIVGRYL